MLTQQIAWTMIAGALILFWLTFAVLATPEIRTTDTIVVMQYGRGLEILALISALSPATLLATLTWHLAWRSEQTLAIAGCAFLALGFIAGMLLIEVVRVRVILSDEGITRHSPWVGSATLKWSDVQSVQWSPIHRWHVIRGASATIRVSQYLTGQKELQQIIRDKVA